MVLGGVVSSGRVWNPTKHELDTFTKVHCSSNYYYYFWSVSLFVVPWQRSQVSTERVLSRLIRTTSVVDVVVVVPAFTLSIAALGGRINTYIITATAFTQLLFNTYQHQQQTASSLPPPRKIYLHRRLFVCLFVNSRITHKLLIRMLQNWVERWHNGHGRNYTILVVIWSRIRMEEFSVGIIPWRYWQMV